jgi:hypothetical protein
VRNGARANHEGVRTRTKAAIAAAALAVLVAVVGGYFFRRVSRARLRAIDAIPGNAFLVLTFDVDALRRSPLGAPVFGGVASKLAGEKALTDLCGFDPLARMTEIAVAVPEEGERGDFGVAIRADVSKLELLGCAKKAIESRQPGAAAPTLRESGTYTLVDPDSPDDDPLHRYPTLAYRDGGPFLIGRGPWLSAMIDTVEGRLPSVAESPHAGLRRDLASALGTEKPTALATAILPRAFRERMRTELAAELAFDEPTTPKPSDGPKAAILQGILGVTSAGAAIQAGPSGSDSQVTMTALFRCEDKGACAELEKLIGRRRFGWSQDIALRLTGVGPLLDAMKIGNEGLVLRVTTHAPSDDASHWLDRVLTLRGPRHPKAGPLVPVTPSVTSSVTPTVTPPLDRTANPP